MPIRITHGKVSTIAQFGIEAGKAEQRVRQNEIDAKQQANALRINADITKTILNAQSRQEAMQFESFMRGESAKRAIAWEQEKTELRNQHDFDMLEQRREIENQLSIDSDSRQKSKLSTKLQALDDAVERGDITEGEAQREKLRLEIGVPGSQSPLFKKKDESSIFSDYLDQLDKEREAERKDKVKTALFTPVKPRDIIAPRQAAATQLLTISKSKNISSGDAADIQKILAEGNDNKIKNTLDIMQAKIAAGVQAQQAASPGFTFRQSMGSFR